MTMRRMPPVVEKALKDRSSSYLLGLRDGTILEFTGAGPLGDTGWVKLDGALRGVDARPLFQAMFAEFENPGAAFSMKQQFVEGDYAYILWTAETADKVYEIGTDTLVVRDGKIVAQSFAGKITPKG